MALMGLIEMGVRITTVVGGNMRWMNISNGRILMMKVLEVEVQEMDLPYWLRLSTIRLGEFFPFLPLSCLLGAATRNLTFWWDRIKHRRRTSASQLKVLEYHFDRNPKPDVNLRKSLAEQLGMTPREVQVWVGFFFSVGRTRCDTRCSFSYTFSATVPESSSESEEAQRKDR